MEKELLQVTNTSDLTLSAQDVYDFVRERLAKAAAEERGAMESTLSNAQAIETVEDAATYLLAGEAILAIKKGKKAAEGRFEEVKAKSNKVHKGVTTTITDVLEGSDAEIKRLNGLRGGWDKAEKARRADEERRLQAIARKEAEDTQIAEAAELEAQGHHADAAAVMAEEPTAAPVVLQDTTPKVAGGSNRTVWKCRIKNDALVPREYLTPDMEKIGRVVRATKGSVQIAGVEAYPEDNLATKSR